MKKYSYIELNEANISIGIANKKENFVADLKDKPRYIAITIVSPDLEKPGNIAIDWAMPINKAYL